MVNNFMTFSDLMEEEHYDLVIGDEAWDVDYYYHENPELKRQPFVFLTDFVGCLPMSEATNAKRSLCADRNADDIEHVARFPYVRDAAIFVGNARRRDRAIRSAPGCRASASGPTATSATRGYALPFDPRQFADTEAIARKTRLRPHASASRSPRSAAPVSAGTCCTRSREAFPHMKRQVPELRMILVTGPRLAPDAFPRIDGLEVQALRAQPVRAPRVLRPRARAGRLEHHAWSWSRRAGRSSASRSQRHFEQCVHVRRRLANYGADHSVDYRDLTPEALADQALRAMHAPVATSRSRPTAPRAPRGASPTCSTTAGGCSDEALQRIVQQEIAPDPRARAQGRVAKAA